MHRDPREPRPEFAPTPFTAEEIREGCPSGRVMRHRIEAADRPTVIQEIRFLEGDADWSEREGRVFSEAGEPMAEPKRSRHAWMELMAHAKFPAGATSIEDVTIELPAGKFDCQLYTVIEGKLVREFWFAKDLPGMPVAMQIEEDGNRRMRMELVENRYE